MRLTASLMSDSAGRMTNLKWSGAGQWKAVPWAPMLAYLEEKLSDQDLTNVTLVNAGFLSYTHPGIQADFVYSRYALHHLPDFWKAIALDRMRKLLSPGGICRLWDVVYDFNPAEATERIEAWCSGAGPASTVSGAVMSSKNT